MSRSVQKKNFLLLELIVAFSLFALCGTYFMMRPTLLHRKEVLHLLEMEYERVAENSLAEVQETLRSQYPFDNFVRQKKAAKELSLEPVEIPLGRNRALQVKRQVRVWEKRACGDETSQGKILKCELILKTDHQKSEKKFEWRFFIKRIPLPLETDNASTRS